MIYFLQRITSDYYSNYHNKTCTMSLIMALTNDDLLINISFMSNFDKFEELFEIFEMNILLTVACKKPTFLKKLYLVYNASINLLI